MDDWKKYINKVNCMDCMDLLKQIPDKSIDLVLTDPPYDKETHKNAVTDRTGKFGNIGFESIDIVPMIEIFLQKTKRWVIVFTTIENLGLIRKQYKDLYIRGGIWDRIVNTPQISGDRPAQACEGIAILHNKGRKKWNGGGKAGIWRKMVNRGTKQHPTEKPLELISQLVSDFSYEEELIIDPFMGSWTTAVACQNLKRNFIGCELDEDYCNIGKERLRQKTLF